MRVWPGGTLRRLREWCDEVGTLLIADEVMTGFGRTGRMFACEHEDVQPDLYIFAKGLTGGYLPLAITLISHKVLSLLEIKIRMRPSSMVTVIPGTHWVAQRHLPVSKSFGSKTRSRR